MRGAVASAGNRPRPEGAAIEEAWRSSPPDAELKVPLQWRRSKGPVIVLLAWAAANLAGAMWLASRGLDLTDEGFYLNSISHPRDDRASILLFGYVYHPLYLLFGGDIVLLRWAGLLITTISVAILAWVALGTPALVGRTPLTPTVRCAVSMALGSLSPIAVVQYPLTPSYNALTEQALSLSTAGLIVGLSRKGGRAAAGWALLGVAAWLTFLGKPTSAAALGVVVMVAIVVTFRRSPKRILQALATTLGACLASLAVTLILARMSLTALVTLLANGLETSEVLGGHSRIVRWDDIPWAGIFWVTLAAVVTIAFLGSLASSQGRSSESSLAQAAVATTLLVGSAALVVAVFALWRARGLVTAAQLYGPATAFGGALLGLLTVLAAAARHRFRHSHAEGGPPAEDRGLTRVVMVVVLVLLPGVYALGTNNNLWSTQGRAVVFPVIALTALLSGRPAAIVAVPLSGLLFLAPLLATSAVSPYRYASLLSATVRTDVGSAGTVGLTRPDSARITHILAIPEKVGLKPGTPIVDLTGDSPGYVYLLGGRAVGQAWLLGGYPGSKEAAVLAIEHDRCELENAWVLAGKGQPRAIEETVLHTFGLDLHRDFKPVASFAPNRAQFGAEAPEAPTQVYAPTHTTPQAGCA